MPAKQPPGTQRTSAERIATMRARRREQGLKEVRNLWARPEDEPKIRAFAASLASLSTDDQEARP